VSHLQHSDSTKQLRECLLLRIHTFKAPVAVLRGTAQRHSKAIKEFILSTGTQTKAASRFSGLHPESGARHRLPVQPDHQVANRHTFFPECMGMHLRIPW